MSEMLYTVKETSKILKTNTDYVYSLIRKGYLRCLKRSLTRENLLKVLS